MAVARSSAQSGLGQIAQLPPRRPRAALSPRRPPPSSSSSSPSAPHQAKLTKGRPPSAPLSTPFTGLRYPSPQGRNVHSTTSALPHWLDPSAPEPFVLFNTAVLVPWGLMIIAPKWDVTKKLLGPTWFMVPYALIDTAYFIGTAVLDAQNGEDVNAKAVFLFTEAITDPAKMLTLFDSAAYAGQDWVHVCTWDMLAGRWIWLDALANALPMRFALFTAFSSGPPGLLVYLLTRALLQKPEDKDKQITEV